VLTMPVLVSHFFFAICMDQSNYSTFIHKPSPQSSSLAAKPNLSLPAWAFWDWNQKYLPKDIHIRWHEFNVALEKLQEYTFVDRDEGSSVVLGFGLLVCECWRVVEVEDDDEDSSQFFETPFLAKKGLRRLSRPSKR